MDDEEFMKMGWDDLLGEHVQAWAESEGGGWTADQVWIDFFFFGNFWERGEGEEGVRGE